MKPAPISRNFIHQIIDQDLEDGRYTQPIVTRFPPEPNGYLHIGHAKSICLNFGMAAAYGGRCNLRFDDTNPLRESREYVESIKRDVHWLGFEWGDRELYASDYFEQFHDFARQLIRAGKAYVCELTQEQIREYRGTLTSPGRPSPYRSRSVDENLECFERMRRGEYADGTAVLRARIDMESPNLNLRDPVMYRVQNCAHHRTGDTWHIYPMYDFAHGLEDSIEGVTHSICTLEFEDHRPLYNWFLEQLGVFHPRQIEFARLNLSYTVMSKRKLAMLVEQGHVDGWDDPRMPTLAGMRRRGYTAAAIRAFADSIGVAKSNSQVDIAQLEHFVREDLNQIARRVMVVLDPLKVVITSYPEDKTEYLAAENNPERPEDGNRDVPFSRVLYIERSDFMEDPPKKYFRLAPGREIRLKHAYYIRCEHVVKDADGRIIELHCTHDPESRGGWTDDGRKVKGTAHWVSATHALNTEVRLYDHLFRVPNPSDVAEGQDFTDNINPDSLQVIRAMAEPGLAQLQPGEQVQFLRQGYFCVDPDSTPEAPVFNRTLGLKSSWKPNSA